MDRLSVNQLIVLLDHHKETMRGIDSKEQNEKTYTEQVLYSALFVATIAIEIELSQRGYVQP